MRPYLPLFVEDETFRTVVLEDGEVLRPLVELDAAIEAAAVLRVAIEALARAAQTRFLLNGVIKSSLPSYENEYLIGFSDRGISVVERNSKWKNSISTWIK